MMNVSRFAVTAGAVALSVHMQQRNVASCEATKNSAFVFIKPHANTNKAQHLVKREFATRGVKVLEEGELSAQQIDEGKLIDQHYYAIASKATLLQPEQLPVPANKFQEAFGMSWEKALQDHLVYNALDACKYWGITSEQLDAAWADAKKVKFGGGFYCGLVNIPGKKPLFVFNGFFMAMRAKFVTPGTSIHYYVVEFDPKDLSWSDFRGKVLGPTDPNSAPADSLRGKILHDWKELGLAEVPNVGDNGVHASASPFEGLAERSNWLHQEIKNDPFGAKLLKAGLSEETIKNWTVDPQVKGKSLFDSLEDMDSDVCIAKAVELNKK